MATAEQLSCRHRGAKLSAETANTCEGKKQVEGVYACDLHEKCTLTHLQLRHPNGAFYATCDRCWDRSPVMAGEEQQVQQPLVHSPRPLQPPVNPVAVLAGPQSIVQPQPNQQPVARAERNPPTKKLTVGMAFYEKSTEVTFTLMALRLMHPFLMSGDVEIICIDNKPDSAEGKTIAGHVRAWIPNGKYVPFPFPVGTSAPRDHLFQIAEGEIVICMDAHVMLQPGAIQGLMQFMEDNPKNRDLIHGPMLSDGLSVMATHFDPIWRSEMYGVWGNDERGINPNRPPFEIPMCGLGVFACRRDAWPGFPPYLAGFGGEEGMIHEKFRKVGGRTLCLPLFRWWHYFGRPYGVPYPLTRENKVRNYLIWAKHLDISPEGIFDHFLPIMGKAGLGRLVDEVQRWEVPGV